MSDLSGNPILFSADDNAINNRIKELERQNKIMREALQWSYEMFLARDQMNAKVHCSLVRLSPITERVKQAIDLVDALNEVDNGNK